jgi:hypothetical protein
MLFTFPSNYAIRIFDKNQEELKLNGTHQTLVTIGGVNLLGVNTLAVRASLDKSGAPGRLPRQLSWRLEFRKFVK